MLASIQCIRQCTRILTNTQCTGQYASYRPVYTALAGIHCTGQYKYTIPLESSHKAVNVHSKSCHEVRKWQAISIPCAILVGVVTIEDGRVFEDSFEVPQCHQICGLGLLFRQHFLPLAGTFGVRSQQLQEQTVVTRG